MIFEPGNSYYWLTPGELEELRAMLQEEGLDYDLADDFELAEDGNYYAASGLIDSYELEFMEAWGFGNYFEYKKSTQSTSPV